MSCKQAYIAEEKGLINNNNMADQLGKRQIEASEGKIGKATLEANQEISAFKEKYERTQKESRMQDEARRQERFTRIQEESGQSTMKYTALEMKNAELKEEDDCEKLAREIEEQKRHFDEITGAKKKIIQEFEQELRKKDDDYGKMLKEQAKDVREMVARMREQFFRLRELNLEELKVIQRRHDEERKIYIEKMVQKVDDLLNKHIKMENESAENRRRTEDEFVKIIDNLRIQGAKEYSDSKIRIEREIQDLEKCYEEMNALYQLNTEKLEYNLKVLKEKNEENGNNESTLRRKNAYLSQRLATLKKELDRNSLSFKKDNKDLTQNYKRITRQFKELQKKFKHFEKADLDRYSQIQAMNEKEVEALERKIIACDKTIHLQQLGVEWIGNPEKEEREKPQAINFEENPDEEVKILVSEEKLGEILEIVINEADFMFDDKMRE
jgi:dynein regulatory complex protein 1